MKTYRDECVSYSINELTPEAQEKAHGLWLADGDCPWGDENRATLDEFCRIFDIKMLNWSYDSNNYNYRFQITNDTLNDGEIGLSGLRLATYIWNNYAQYITKMKYYSKSKIVNGEYISKHRYSKVLAQVDNHALTSYYMDYDILEPIIKCLTYKELYDSYEELIEECLESFFNACKSDYEYQESMEYFIDAARANNYEYNEDGSQFWLPSGFKEAV